MSNSVQHDPNPAAESSANALPEERRVRGYMCKVDWDHELGEACGGSTIYPSLENLKPHHPMWKECGVVEVETRLVEVAVPEDLELMMANATSAP
jgi:hypothetical protein